MTAPPPGPLPSGLARKRALARAALWWEAAWPAAWPALAVLGLFLVFALLGVPALLPPWLHLLALAGFAAALGLALRHAGRTARPPRPEAAERRLERDSGLAHRPIAALADRPAGQDAAALALWAAHQARMAALVRRLRVAWPSPGLAARDPRALRGGLVVAVGAALLIAGADAPGLLGRALVPHFAPPPGPAPLRVEAWITPPAYTGAPPVFLAAQGGEASVPAGSLLQVTVSGGAAVPELLGLPGAGFAALGGGGHAARAPLVGPARATLRQDGRDVAEWRLDVRPDAPPVAAFWEAPARAPRGLALRLPWRVEDDWGVAALRAEMLLDARPQLPPIQLDIPLPSGQVRQARGLAQPELSAHPWAGLEVRLRLVATDGAGQAGESESVVVTLPERSFNHPVARAMIEVRKALSRDANARAGAIRDLDALAAAPEAFEHDTATLLALRVARALLQRDRRPEAVPEVQELIWEAALALEEGQDGRTARALAEALRTLREALTEAERQRDEAQRDHAAREDAERANPRDDAERANPRDEAERANPRDAEQRAEIQRRIEQLREAIRRHMEAMAERLQRENAEALPYDPQQRLLDQRDMDRRTRRMEEANRQDRMQDAQRELADLEEMLRALQEGRSARGESPERQRQRERGQQQMGAVQDMVRRQSEMLDREQRRAEQGEQRRAEERRQQQPWNMRPPAPGTPSAEQRQEAEQQARRDAEADARRQRALRRALGELMQQHGDLTGEVPEPLGRADQAMREAQEALGEGRDARPAQQEAIRRLQEGGRQMAQQMQRQFGQGQGEGQGEDGEGMEDGFEMGGDGQDGEQQLGEGRDPLGRRGRESAGSAEHGSDTRVPDEAEQLRARRLQDELRRRGAERERPAEELDYIDRLLRRF